MDIIILEELVLEAYVGVSSKERGASQQVSVTVSIETDFSNAILSDCVEDTINYSVVKQDITELLQENQFTLLETLAHTVAACILRDPRACRVTVSVQKLRIWQNGKPGVTIMRENPLPS